MAEQSTFDRAKVEAQYGERLNLYKRLEGEALFILNEVLVKAQIKRHSLASRVKQLDSLISKAERQQLTDPLSQLNDIVGIRVVCLFLSDINQVGRQIRGAFRVISEDNKIEGQPASSFGYMSVHFLVRMKEEYKGPRYDALSGITFEIQVRTIAMDAWAAASHYLDYKTDLDIPEELRKDFYALSGLFYVADRHFEMFAKQRESAQSTLKEQLNATSSRRNIELNLDSLSAYLKSKFPDRNHLDSESISELVKELRTAGIGDLEQLDEIVDAGWDAFLEYEKKYPPTVGGKKGKFADVGVIRVLCEIASAAFFKVLHREHHMSTEYVSRFETYRKLLKKRRSEK